MTHQGSFDDFYVKVKVPVMMGYSHTYWKVLDYLDLVSKYHIILNCHLIVLLKGIFDLVENEGKI